MMASTTIMDIQPNSAAMWARRAGRAGRCNLDVLCGCRSEANARYSLTAATIPLRPAIKTCG
jgi:hypothetical protein